MMDYEINEVKDERFKILQNRMIEYIEQKSLNQILTLKGPFYRVLFRTNVSFQRLKACVFFPNIKFVQITIRN